MNFSPGSACNHGGCRYRVGVVGAAQRAGVQAVRRAAYGQATEFDWKDEARLAWNCTDDEGTVIALWDAQGQVLSTVRANVFTERDPAEELLEYSLAGIDVCMPVLVLSRAATHPGVARQGFNSVVRYAYLAAAAASRMACVVTLVYDGSPRLRSMREAGFALSPPRLGWDTEAVARTQPLLAWLPQARIEGALRIISQAMGDRLDEVCIDAASIAQAFRTNQDRQAASAGNGEGVSLVVHPSQEGCNLAGA